MFATAKGVSIMANLSPLALWRRFLAMPNDSPVKAMGVAFLVALVAAVTVSATAVALKPRQEAHVAAARQASLDAMMARLPGLEAILRDSGAERLEAVVVALDSGQIDPAVEAASFDYLAAQTDTAQGLALSADEDIARIGHRPSHAPAYLLQGRDGLALVVLPVYGTGYQSTIRAYLALHSDLVTVAALSVYEQGETPGLGSRVTDPAWQASWAGKTLRDADGAISITVVRGAASAETEVDGLTGATRSATGVANLVRFWLGPQGFGPFLDQLKAGGQ